MMKSIFPFLLLLLGSTWTITAQNINLIIQVNERLVISGLTNVYVVVGHDNNSVQTPVNYVPGKLTLTNEIWNTINTDSSRKITLHFDYNTYSKKKHNTANFYVDLAKQQLQNPYLILNIYDFRDKKYKHWYQWHTDKSFLAELTFPGSGLYIRQK